MKPAPLVVIWLFAIQLMNMQVTFGQIHPKTRHHTKIKSSIFPVLPKYAKRLEGFVPKGWKIKDTVTGDLNKDKAADAVIVLEYRYKVVEHGDETHPRILMIAFNAGDHYELKLQHNTFILHNREIYDLDPYRDITISEGALFIHFDLPHDGEDDDLLYIIRYQMSDFYLTEATHKSRSNSGYECSTDFNFLTRKYVYKSSFPNGSGKHRKTKQKI
ncbi:MAG TPA: hypothetical protein VK671_09900, partial [Mucilaginibacter sp.]|nr:hypothetical protein [Mucilaginibacter sp.]